MNIACVTTAMPVSADYDVGPGFHRAANYCTVVRIVRHDLMFPRAVDDACVRFHVSNQELNRLGQQTELPAGQHVLILTEDDR
jgi:hypothetical protein